MVTQAPSRAAIFAAIAFALSCFVATLFVWQQFGGAIPLGPQGYRFTANFAQASSLVKNADVRISGVPVGKVVKVTPRGELTEATIEMQHRFAPVPSDARAILRSKTLAGETFVELSPGTRTAPKLKDGGRLSAKQIVPTQQLDQVLGAFDEPTRQALKSFLINLGDALKGRSGDLNAALGNATPTAENLKTFVDILNAQSPAVSTLVRDGGVSLRALGRRSAELQSLIVAGDQVFAETAARGRAVTDTTRLLPPFLKELRSTLRVADVTAAEAAPTLRVLRPVAPLVRPALVNASTLAPQLTALFRELRPVITSAKTALPAATTVVREARPLIDQLYPAGRELVPVVELLGAYTNEIVAALANLGTSTQATNVTDGRDLHYLRALLPLGNETVFGYNQRQGSNRHNAYIAPGGIGALATGGLKAFDCKNVGNPQVLPVIGSGSPPCMVQSPWTFRGATRSYPHAEREGP